MSAAPWLEVAVRELVAGVSELPGELHSARILEYWKAVDHFAPQDDETPWCLDDQVEILTDVGWQRIAVLEPNRLVAQVWPESLRAELVRPHAIIHKQYSGQLVEFASDRLHVVTDQKHRWLTTYHRNAGGAGQRVRSSEEVARLSTGLNLPACTTSAKHNEAWSDRDLSLAAAWLSDGSCFRAPVRRFLHRSNPGRLTIQVSKVRKRGVLLALRPVHQWTAPRAYGRSRTPLTDYDFEIPPGFSTAGLLDKRPSWTWLWTLSHEQLRTFLDAYVVFDGSQRGESRILYSSRDHIADWLSAAIALAGWCPSAMRSATSRLSGRPCYSVRWSPSKASATVKPTSISRFDGEAELHCVSVPSGFILCRDRLGRPFVTGNCSALANFCMAQVWIQGTRRANARSWLTWGRESALVPGAVVVLWRGSPAAATGHVAFYLGQGAGQLALLGGNQADSVSVALFPKARLLGARWPVGDHHR